MYDYHMHSSFSGDCQYTMEEMICGAIDKNVNTIVFTDHIDYDCTSDNIDFTYDLADYFKELSKLKLKYKDSLEVLAGIEIGMQPHLSEKVAGLINNNNFDFVIMSTHIVKGLDLHDGSFYKNKKIKEIYYGYYEDLLENIKNIEDFSVVGHIDLVDRYQKYFGDKLNLKDYKDILEIIFKKLISMGKGIEINTSGIRYGINNFHPTKEIVNFYKELGGEIITIGSDAHTPQDIVANYDDAVDLLKELNFKYLTIFKDMKPKFIKIK